MKILKITIQWRSLVIKLVKKQNYIIQKSIQKKNIQNNDIDCFQNYLLKKILTPKNLVGGK